MRSKHVEYLQFDYILHKLCHCFHPQIGENDVILSSQSHMTSASMRHGMYHFPQSTLEDEINMADDFLRF